jgi:hypothetical protein
VTLLLDLDIPPHIVREIVGHLTIEVSMTIYAHASLTLVRRTSAVKGGGDPGPTGTVLACAAI